MEIKDLHGSWDIAGSEHMSSWVPDLVGRSTVDEYDDPRKVLSGEGKLVYCNMKPNVSHDANLEFSLGILPLRQYHGWYPFPGSRTLDLVT